MNMFQGYWMTPKIENKDINYVFFSNQIKVRKLLTPRACKLNLNMKHCGGQQWNVVSSGLIRASFSLPPHLYRSSSETLWDSGQLTHLWLPFIEGQILAICLHVYSFSRQFQMHFVYRSSLNLPRRLPGESKREFIGFHPLLPRPPASPYKLFIKRSSQLAEIGCDVWVSQHGAPPRPHLLTHSIRRKNHSILLHIKTPRTRYYAAYSHPWTWWGFIFCFRMYLWLQPQLILMILFSLSSFCLPVCLS